MIADEENFVGLHYDTKPITNVQVINVNEDISGVFFLNFIS
jgi:hypothetical protein